MKKLFKKLFVKKNQVIETRQKRTIETHGWEVGAKAYDDFHNYMKGLKHG
ncbi:TPA: hypothetical protein VA403_000980 [Streptococcus agalactiae]|nr:hypothetical protein [Streptococcus agalactiae]